MNLAYKEFPFMWAACTCFVAFCDLLCLLLMFMKFTCSMFAKKVACPLECRNSEFGSAAGDQCICRCTMCLHCASCDAQC
jgi:hypothetical protein